MYLKRLQLIGFKSFARPTTLEFTDDITAIVGPNGSGKSNIAEAIRFVLGEQSIKSLRGKRGEDLIFNGSKNIARLNRASVSIVFDNTKRIFDLDYDEVEIKRAVYRDATNQYFINGNRVRLKDIIETLSKIHIGASSHHIISQGESDRILNASIKERRIMIEDALGLRIFHYKKAESERKLKKTQENIEKVESLRKEIVPHMRFLENQVEKVKKAEQMKLDLKDLFKEYLQKEEAYIRWQEEKIRKEKNEPQQELYLIESTIEEKTAKLEVLDERQGKNQKVIEIETKLYELRDQKDSFSRQLGRLEGMLEYEERRVEKSVEKEKIKEDSDEYSISIPIKKLKNFIEKIKDILTQGEETHDVESFRSLLNKIREITSRFYNDHGDFEESQTIEKNLEISKPEEDYNHIQSQKIKVDDKLKALKEEEEELIDKRTGIREKIEKEKSSERILERELFEFRSRKTELVSKLELIAVHTERLEEEKVRFKEEKIEAGHLIGIEAIRYESADIKEDIKEDKEISSLRVEQETKRRSIERMKIKIEDIGGGGEDVLKEYEEVKERDLYLKNETEDLQKSVAVLNNLISELGDKINIKFKEGIKKINIEFQELFNTMFDGGSALIKLVTPPPKAKQIISEDGVDMEMEYIEEEDQEEGVDVVINLPQKRLKGLHMLSGGERSLVSIALIFAISRVNPPPFLVLDETDAALDEINARKYGTMIEKLSEETQFILITHTRETMSKAKVLYGVTAAADGVSRLLSIKFNEATELSK